MFVRKKLNKSGAVSVQLIEKRLGKSVLVKTVGSSGDPKQIDQLLQQGRHLITRIKGQASFNFDQQAEEQLVNLFFNGIRELSLAGPELLLGKLFDEIGFGIIKDELFRHLVLTRLCYPVSKLKTTDYLFKHMGISIDVERVYRYLDKVNTRQKQQVQQISYQHTLQILDNRISLVFYDVTTLYFEASDEDDLRKTGFSKDGKHRQPQIVLQAKNYQYIIGARIKNESQAVQQQILATTLKNGESIALQRDIHNRIIISYSDAGATKDAANRKRGLEKLEKNLAAGKLTKQHINNRGYNKYLKLEGDIKISIDTDKYKADANWDGLKGYLTNTQLSKDEIIENYKHLWQIEKAFRISKTDLKIRPIYHRLKHRIEAHICIAFCSYKIYKELERQLQIKKAAITAEKAIEITKTIYRITIQTNLSNTLHSRLYIDKDEQRNLLNLFDIYSG